MSEEWHAFGGSQTLINNNIHNTGVLYPPTPLSLSPVVLQYAEKCTIAKKIRKREKVLLSGKKHGHQKSHNVHIRTEFTIQRIKKTTLHVNTLNVGKNRPNRVMRTRAYI